MVRMRWRSPYRPVTGARNEVEWERMCYTARPHVHVGIILTRVVTCIGTFPCAGPTAVRWSVVPALSEPVLMAVAAHERRGASRPNFKGFIWVSEWHVESTARRRRTRQASAFVYVQMSCISKSFVPEYMYCTYRFSPSLLLSSVECTLRRTHSLTPSIAIPEQGKSVPTSYRRDLYRAW